MRVIALLLPLLLILSACGEQDPNAYYTCFGGVKVRSLAECNFDGMDVALENCDKVIVYETNQILTTPDEVVPAFNLYIRDAEHNITLVQATYYKMMDSRDYYRMNFYDYDDQERKQYFIDDYGRIYKPENCITE